MPTLEFQCCGVLEQVCGGSTCRLSVPAFPVSVADALARLAEAYPAVQGHVPYTACAVGDAIVPRDYALQPGETLVLLPPVSGG